MKLCPFFRTLVLSCVLFCGSSPGAFAANAPQPADVIIFNAKVITVNSNFALAEAVAVRGDSIIAVGKDRQIERLKGPDTWMIDAHGRTVMPGLYDSDIHSYQAAVSESNAPVIHSIVEGLDYIRHQAADKPADSWIVVERAYPTRLTEGRLPTKAELDKAAPKHPVYWNCGALAMINSRALALAKITSATTNPPGGELVLEETTHQPTGLLRNAASLLKLPTVRPPSASQRRKALKHLYQLYNEQGITSITESAADPEAIDFFRELSQSGELTVRINCARLMAPGATPDETLARLAALTNAPPGKLPYGPTGVGDDWVRIGPLKTRMDGSILDATAYMRTPWGIGPTYQITEPADRGVLYVNPDLAADLFLQAAQADWQISADCTGDAALDQLLNCFQKVQFKTDITKRRFLINHASFQADQDWSRCKQLGIVASLQPDWLYCDGASLEKTFGNKRLVNFLAFKSWFDCHLIIGAGSDHAANLDSLASTNPWNPWLGIWITLARQTEQGAEIWPEEKLTREQAIQFYTINNAYLSFDEKKKGSLEPGKLADLIMIDNDILKCPLDNIRQTKVQLTMVGGKIVWQAK
jgi:predicted amidohydrolase YtcJ